MTRDPSWANRPQGTALDAANRRGFPRITRRARLQPDNWAPRELRHSFVSLLSDDGVSIEDIADLCGHTGTHITKIFPGSRPGHHPGGRKG